MQVTDPRPDRAQPPKKRDVMFIKKPPKLLDTQERAEAVREAYDSTRDLRRNGTTGFVLLALTVGKDGSVESARAVMPPKWAADRVRVVATDVETGAVLPPPPPHTLHPDLCRVAEAAARSYQFQPATLLGRPVRYRGYRSGFSFPADP
jgi:hypothetical protein